MLPTNRCSYSKKHGRIKIVLTRVYLDPNNPTREGPAEGNNTYSRYQRQNHRISIVSEKERTCRINIKALRSNFYFQRKIIARKLNNPRVLKIHLYTFRRWKGPTEYHKTKDIIHIMRILGHKNIKNTLIYTQLIDFKDEEYISKVANSPKKPVNS